MKKLIVIALSAAVAFPAGAWSAEIVESPLPIPALSMTGVSIANAPAPGIARLPSLTALQTGVPAMITAAAAAAPARAAALMAAPLPAASIAESAAKARPSSSGEDRRDAGALRSAVAAASTFVDRPESAQGLYDGSAGRGRAAEAVSGYYTSDSRSGLAPAGAHDQDHHHVPKFHQLHSPLGERISHFYSNLSYAMRETALPIVLMAAVGLGAAGMSSYHHESVRAQTYPLGFSEIGQIENDAEYAHRGPLGPMTRYLTSTNDLVMKIMESYNEANDKSYVLGTPHKFAFELDNRINYKFHRYEIQDYFKNLPGQAQAARAELEPFIRAKAGVDAADEHLSRAWSESHEDHYHTHRWTTIEKDADGKGTHTEDHEEQVYDDTTHTYEYDAAEGAAGASQLTSAIAANGKLSFTETIPTASQTNAEGEYAAEVSRKAELKGKRLDQNELTAISQTWKTGSTLLNNLPEVGSEWNALHGGSVEWNGAKNRARSESYTTTSHTDAGPEEYQVSEKVLHDGRQFSGQVDEVLKGIDYTEQNTPVMEQKVHQLIGSELDYAKGGESPKKLTAEIVDISRNIYTMNFKKGLDFQRFRLDMLALFSVLGGIGGGLLGLLWKKLIARFSWFAA